ncbi:MAG: hypothetical protein R2821_12660 [Flavobacteriaceae bacterium]
MKMIFLLCVLALTFVSCENKAKPVVKQILQANEVSESSTQEVSESQKIAEKLAKTTPLTEDELKNAFPKRIKDLEIDKEPIVLGQQVMGMFGDHKISLSVTDAAGTSNQLASHFIDNYSFHNEEDNESFKWLKKERDGIKTYASYYTSNGQSEITMLLSNRFYVIISNNDNRTKMTPDELWVAIDHNVLKNFK